jgi:hypothetical protein
MLVIGRGTKVIFPIAFHPLAAFTGLLYKVVSGQCSKRSKVEAAVPLRQAKNHFCCIFVVRASDKAILDSRGEP